MINLNLVEGFANTSKRTRKSTHGTRFHEVAYAHRLPSCTCAAIFGICGIYSRKRAQCATMESLSHVSFIWCADVIERNI